MGEITVACVMMGSKYDTEYADKLRNMVLRHSVGWDIDFRLFTDGRGAHGWNAVEVDPVDDGWWGKISLFDTKRRGDRPTVYFDLDTVIVGDLGPLFKVATKTDFSICRNFTQLVSPSYPCGFGSCVMTFERGWGADFWDTYIKKRALIRHNAGIYGDQWAIQKFYPRANILQDMLPPGYFVGRRDFSAKLPEDAAIMVFAGKHKPHNTRLGWVKEHWK